MNRLVLVLAAVVSSYVVACAAPTADGTVENAPATEEPAAELEATPHSAPAPSEAPEGRERNIVGSNEGAAFEERRVGAVRFPVPTPKPGIEVDAPIPQ